MRWGCWRDVGSYSNRHPSCAARSGRRILSCHSNSAQTPRPPGVAAQDRRLQHWCPSCVAMARPPAAAIATACWRKIARYMERHMAVRSAFVCKQPKRAGGAVRSKDFVRAPRPAAGAASVASGPDGSCPRPAVRRQGAVSLQKNTCALLCTRRWPQPPSSWADVSAAHGRHVAAAISCTGIALDGRKRCVGENGRCAANTGVHLRSVSCNPADPNGIISRLHTREVRKQSVQYMWNMRRFCMFLAWNWYEDLLRKFAGNKAPVSMLYLAVKAAANRMKGVHLCFPTSSPKGCIQHVQQQSNSAWARNSQLFSFAYLRLVRQKHAGDRSESSGILL